MDGGKGEAAARTATTSHVPGLGRALPLETGPSTTKGVLSVWWAVSVAPGRRPNLQRPVPEAKAEVCHT
jgi:hypothetical protein